jgi:hypothetical protein
MAYILSDIIQYLKFDETDIDNWIFKLYHKGCGLFFLVGSMISIFSQVKRTVWLSMEFPVEIGFPW